MNNGCVELREIPYPYRAMLAICSDLDETQDRHVYLEIMRFLNTTEPTSMGSGVGLEIGNTIYFDMPPDQFAYWNTDDAGRAMVCDFIRSGHIDCLHSFGDLAQTRKYAERALDELDRHDCRLEVWIDHSVAPTNFGADIMKGYGDQPGHEAYHADLTTAYGVKYVWRGRVTSVVGQDVPPSLGGLLTHRAPVASTRTVAKELAKRFLARFGNSQYEMHASNAILRKTRLRDDTPVYEFLRSNPHWGGVSSCSTGREISQVLSGAFLNRLVQRGGVCILYTHLGKIRDASAPFDEATLKAFRQLADSHWDGQTLVTTTRRLLGYCRAVREVNWTASRGETDGAVEIAISTQVPSEVGRLTRFDLDGLTFYVPDPTRTRVTLNAREVDELQRNDPDHTRRPSVSIPWPRLELPSL